MNLLNLAQAAARLVAAIGDQAARDEENYRRGWQDAASVFFQHGVEVGRQSLSHELVEQDRRRTEYIHGIATAPSYAELEVRRWDGRREDFGKPRPGDFPGRRRRQAAA